MKHICRILSVLFLSVLLLAGGAARALAAEYDEGTLRMNAAGIISAAVQTDEEALQQLEGMRKEQLEYALVSNGIPCSAEDYLSILHAWQDGIEECGAYPELTDLMAEIQGFELREQSGEIQLVGQIQFEKRAAEVTIGMERDGSVTSLTIGGRYSTAEVMKKAGLNTIIGMGVVFVVLIFISFIISLFKYIGKIQGRSGEKKSQKASVDNNTAETSAEDEDEIMAVIMAVIRAEESRNSRSGGQTMEQYNVTVNGKTYVVEVEKIGRANSPAFHVDNAGAAVAPKERVELPKSTSAPAPKAAPAPAPKAAPAPAPKAAPAPAPAAAPAAAGGAEVTSGVAGKVFKVVAEVGQAVKAGDPVIILEAMKMEIPVVAPVDGTVASISVAVGDPVEAGQVLAAVN